MKAYCCCNPTRVTDAKELIHQGTERECRAAIATALGVRDLRGLAQAATSRGVLYYAPGADDYHGPCCELVP